MTAVSSRPMAWRGNHAPLPLPFAPESLEGLSERLLLSHHTNNYIGAVKRLNLIEQQLSQLASDAPPFLRGALKREELIAFNSMVLHELYFANLCPKAPTGGLESSIVKAYGSYANWEQEFRGTGMALAGGSGWVVVNCLPGSGSLRIAWAGDHTQSLTLGVPLLVMDMYEHSYALDYGPDTQKYINAFMKNINWKELEHRFEMAIRSKGIL